jgi:hypothetical protein
MSIEKYWNGRTKMYMPTCDICGKQLAEEWTFQEAVEAKKNAGWCSRKIDNEWIDLCDDCKRDLSNSVKKRYEPDRNTQP